MKLTPRFSRGWWVVAGLILALNSVAPVADADDAGQPHPTQLEQTAIPAATNLVLQEVVDSSDGLRYPVAMAHAGDARLFIVEQDGQIRIYDGANLLATPFLDIQTRVDSSSSEEGLLGLAFHPDYANNGYFYVNYTNTTGGTRRSRIARFTVTADPDVADPNSEEILLTVVQPASNHNAGAIAFGPDGYLYIPLGDGGSSSSSAQDTAGLLGKIVRIDVDSGPGSAADCVGIGTGNYTVPPSNPLRDGSGGACDEIWALGLRNPWRSSFDRQTGDFWLGDVGAGSREEVDWQPAASAGGENYGWPCYEGSVVNNSSGCSDPSAYEFPVHDYSHVSGRCVVTGGFVYRGNNSLLTEFQGHYFFADYCSGDVWSLSGSNHDLTAFNSITFLPNSASIGAPSSFGEDAAGNLYILKYTFSGSLFKLVDGDLPCTAVAAAAVTPAITTSSGDVLLNWSDNPANSGGYELHRSAAAYFTPDSSSLLATLPAGATSYSDVGAAGETAVNYSYIVRGRNCNYSQTADSAALAEFDFALTPGTP